LGGRRGRKITTEDKLCALQLIHEAQKNGCRKHFACAALGVSIKTVQRWECSVCLEDKRKGPLIKPTHSLTPEEREQMLTIANSKKYADLPVRQFVPKLVDEGIYIASESSFYRVLKSQKQLRHRGKQRLPAHKKPLSYSATAPNQVWSWDISYLPTVVSGLFYYLYIFVDIFSRKIVGFGVYEAERAQYAIDVVEEACANENIHKHQITLHSDNGSPMKASTWLVTLHRLGVTPSFSRPSVSNDNPYSEALFKTLKYCRWYPKKPFNARKEAVIWVKKFVNWYNNEHLHSGLNFISPGDRHKGVESAIMQQRKEVYIRARNNNPKRWTNKVRSWDLPDCVHLNPGRQAITK